MTAINDDLLAQVVNLAGQAGLAIMKIYMQEDLGIRYKDDMSPLTDADLASQKIILAGLASLTPGIPVLSEESALIPYDQRKVWKYFWLVDPLDGTKEFVKRNGEFTVNIALIEGQLPVLGVVHAPALNLTYGCAANRVWKQIQGRQKESIHVAPWESGRLNIVASRSHGVKELEKFLATLPSHECLNIGSALKFCLVAEGKAHLYPRLYPTMEWDTAAAQAVLTAAGGLVTDWNRQPLLYNKENLCNPSFIASGSPPFPWYDFTRNPANPGL